MGELEALARAYVEAEERLTRLRLNALKDKISKLESELFEAHSENVRLQKLLKEKEKKRWWIF